MRYRLRTLLILLAMGPMFGAWGYGAIEQRLTRIDDRQMVEGGFTAHRPVRLKTLGEPIAPPAIAANP
jgi:hypothetical protein